MVVFSKPLSFSFLTRNPRPWAVALVSLAPGLGLAWLGMRKLGMGIFLLSLFGLALLASTPSLGAVCFFGALLYTQMAASAVLAVWVEAARDSAGAGTLPVTNALSPAGALLPGSAEDAATKPGELFQACVAGYDSNLRQSQILAATKSDLLLTHCAASGDTLNIDTIPRSSVFWITLEIWRQHCMIMVEFYSQRPPVILTLPRQAEERAKAFLQEFAGILVYRIPLRDALQSVEIAPAQAWDGLPFLTGLVLLLGGAFIPGMLWSVLRVWSLAAGGFLLFWPLLLLILRGIRSRPQARATNAMAVITLAVLQGLEWGVSLLLLGFARLV